MSEFLQSLTSSDPKLSTAQSIVSFQADQQPSLKMDDGSQMLTSVIGEHIRVHY